MTDSTFILTANTTGSGIEVASPNGLRKASYIFTLFTTGTFGGGTVAYFASPDNGTTLIPLKVAAVTAYTVTANDYLNFPDFGASNNLTTKLSIWAQLTGATTPSVTISVFDNI